MTPFAPLPILVAMRSSRFFLLVVVGLLGASPPAAADATEDGKKSFQLGVNLLTDPDGAKYDEALPHFRRAYELTRNWKVLGNLGLCYLKLERVGEAIDTYERYLKDGGKDIDPDERAQVDKDLATLRAQQVKVHLEVPTAGLALSDERIKPNGGRVLNLYPLSATSVDLALYAGHHVLTVVIQQQPVKWETDLAPGGSASHRFEPSAVAPPATSSAPVPPPMTAPPATVTAPPPATSAPGPAPTSTGLSTPIYVAAGATGLLAVGTAITGILYLGKRSDYHAINGQPTRSRQEVEDARSSASTLSTVSTVLGVATLVGAGVTTYLYLTREGTPAATTGKARLSPWLSPQGGGIFVGGSL